MQKLLLSFAALRAVTLLAVQTAALQSSLTRFLLNPSSFARTLFGRERTTHLISTISSLTRTLLNCLPMGITAHLWLLSIYTGSCISFATRSIRTVFFFFWGGGGNEIYSNLARLQLVSFVNNCSMAMSKMLEYSNMNSEGVD